MPKYRITKAPKKGQFISQMDVLGEEIRTGQKHKKGGKTLATNNNQGYPFQRDQGYMYQDMGGVIVPMHKPDVDGNMYVGGGPTNQIAERNGDIGENFTRYYQENFKKGGKSKKDKGGVIYPFGRSDSDKSCIFENENMKQGGTKNKLHDQNLIGEITNPSYMYTGGPTQWNGFEEVSKMKKGGNWLKGAVNPAHVGYCTPMTKSTCTGRRRAFAETMKKHHGFHKKDRGGVIYPFGGGDPENFKQGGKYIGAGPNTDLNPTTNSSVADYNPYVYFKNKNWYITSNPEDDKITESMKPIDPAVANIEAEKGEYLAKPGLTGLYKITGEKHSAGGTPLYAEGGSFIFSNDPSLAINKQERDAFGFKGGSSTAKSKNTPAQILGKNVDPKDYNAYIATLQSPDTDRIAKTTAGLMLEKLQQKLGQIAYVQESKKGEKPPDFSQGTAPTTQPEFQNIGEKMSEYNYGGMYPYGGVTNPNDSIDPSDAYPGGSTKLGRITPKGVSNTFNYPNGVPQLIKDWKDKTGIDLSGMDSGQAQGAMYDWAMKNNPQMLRNMWSSYGNTAQGQKQGLNYDFDNLNDKQLQDARRAYVDNDLGVRTIGPQQARTPANPGIPPIGPLTPNTPLDIKPPTTGLPEVPGTNQPNPTLPYQIKGKLTDAQIANLGYLGLQSLNINRYYPTRQQVSLPQARLDQINVQPYLNNVNNQAHEQYELASLQPRTSSLIGSNIRGSSIDQANQAIGNVANQNVQIGNQQNLTNLQQMTQQVMANSQFNNQYYNQVQATNQNFDNERRFANNQFMGNLNNYQSQQDQLAWQLASVNKYGMRQVTDPKTGKTYNLPTPLYQPTNNGIQYNGDVASMYMASNYNRINTPQEIAQTYKQFKDSGMPDVEAQRIVSAIIRSRGNQTTGQGPFLTQNPFGSTQ